MTRLLQITDTHLFADPKQDFLGINCYQSLAAIVNQILAEAVQPDLITLTGDLSQDDSVESYQHLLQLLQPFTCPIYWLPGNHDHLPNLQQAFATSPLFNDKIIELADWRLVLLDTLNPGEVSGYLQAEQLQLLQDALAIDDDKSYLILLHHQAVPIACQWLDAIGLSNAAEFLKLIAGHDKVKAVLCGHVHQDVTMKHDNVTYMTTPSTCIQFKPKQQNFALDTQQPGYRWLSLMPDGYYTTEVCRLSGRKFSPDLNIKGY